MHLFFARLRYYFGEEAIKEYHFGDSWARIEFKSAPCTKGHLPFHLNFSYSCRDCGFGLFLPMLTVSIWEKRSTGEYFEMISETRELRLRNPFACDEDGNLTDDTMDLFFRSVFVRSPSKFIPKGSITCEPTLPDEFEAYALDNVLSYFVDVLCSEYSPIGPNQAVELADYIREQAILCLKPCESDGDDEEDCDPDSGDCDEFEDICPDPIVNPQTCVVVANSIISIGNSHTGYGYRSSGEVTSFRRKVISSEGPLVSICESESEPFGEVVIGGYKTFIYDIPSTGDPLTDSQLRIQRFSELYSVNCGSPNDDEVEPDPDEHNDRDPDQRCGFYLIFELSAGVRFEYEVPGQEDVVTSNLQLISYKFEVETPINLTSSEFRLIDLVDPEFGIDVDLDGISIVIGFELKLGDVTVSSSRYSKSFTLEWLLLFPELAPILAFLSNQPITPWAKVGLVGTGRRDC